MFKCARSSGVFLLLVVLIGFPLVIRLEAVGGPRAAPEREAREKWAERYDRPEKERVFRDYWVTPPDGPEGGTYQDVTIPFGFFGPECDGFEGRVHFVGSPLDPGTTGNADTVLERSADPVSARDAEGTTGTVTLRLTQLSLVSKDPIAVECDDGLSLWHVHVGLSSEAPWAGWMTATKTHGDGGTFDSMIYVQPLLTFTNVDDPDDVLVFDTADVSDPAELMAAEVPFVLRVEASIARDDPDSVSGENVPSEFIPGIESPTDSQRIMDDPDYRGPWPRQVQELTPPVVHQAPGHQHCVEPTVLDTFCSTAEITVTIFPGVMDEWPDGFMDILHLSSVGLGDAVVVRTAPPYEDGVDIETEITNLELAGYSPNLGNIVVLERDDLVSDGVICEVDADEGGEFVSGDSAFNVYVQINVLDYAYDVVLDTGEYAVRLQAEGITELPPFGDDYLPQPPEGAVCDQPGGPQTIPLYEVYSGYEVGEITHAMHQPGCCEVELEGPTIICKGATDTFSAIGTPGGGTCSWQPVYTGAGRVTINNPANCSTTITGTETSSQKDDVTLKVTYTKGEEECTDEVKLTVVELEITNPQDTDGNGQINDDANAANDHTGNEFTFSATVPPAEGVLTLPVRARITPDVAEVRAFFENRVKMEVDAIGGSHSPTGPYITTIAWDSSFADFRLGKGVYDAGTQRWIATATFTTLPLHNSDFGSKTVKVTLLDADETDLCNKTEEIEVFWPLLLDPAGPRNDANFAKNHSGPDLNSAAADNNNDGPGERAPNWFYYWREEIPNTGEDRYAGTHIPGFGRAPAVRWFPEGYAGRHDRTLIGQIAQGTDTAGGVTTGIDAFEDTFVHEYFHAIDQSVNYTNEGFGTAITGETNVAPTHWSFRIVAGAAGYNHYLDINGDGDHADTVDLNGDGDTDDRVLESAIVPAAGGPRDVNGDGDQTDLIYEKERLDADGDSVPDWSDGPGVNIESLALGVEPDNQDGRAGVDWGNPGKQHNTISYND